MGRLIDADWLKAQWNEPTDWMDGDQVLHHYTWFKMVLELAPTVDAVPVRHGYWKRCYSRPHVYADLFWHCSVCGGIQQHDGANLYKYCPNCGARMDGKGNSNESD